MYYDTYKKWHDGSRKPVRVGLLALLANAPRSRRKPVFVCDEIISVIMISSSSSSSSIIIITIIGSRRFSGITPEATDVRAPHNPQGNQCHNPDFLGFRKKRDFVACAVRGGELLVHVHFAK